MNWIRRILSSATAHSNAPELCTDLPLEPTDIARAFIADYHHWNDYAWGLNDVDNTAGAVQRAYDQLIAHYCGPAKKPQLPCYSSHSTFTAENSSVAAETGDESRRIVAVAVAARAVSDYEHSFEFDFVRIKGRWILEEVYYLDEYDGNARLNYL